MQTPFAKRTANEIEVEDSISGIPILEIVSMADRPEY